MTYPKWCYNEYKQVGLNYLEQKEVKVYDQRMKKLRDVRKETEEIKKKINLMSDHVLIEIATGTGEFAIEISQYCQEVIAMDVSTAMLEYGIEKARMNDRKNIKFVHAGFLTFQHQRPPVDAIITQLALHHLPDFWKQVALKKIFDMLKAGGKLYLHDVVFASQVEDYKTYFTEIIERIKRAVGQEIAEEIELHIREEYSTLDWIMEDMLKRAGFLIEEVKYYNGFLATYVCCKK